MKHFAIRQINILNILTLLILLNCNINSIPELNHSTLSRISVEYAGKTPLKFTKFIQSLDTSHSYPGLSKRLRGKSTKEDQVLLFRLLGLHTALSREKNMLIDLGKLVAIPSFKKAGTPQYKNPAIKKLGLEIQSIAKRAGLEFQNHENRIFEVTLRGSGNGEFGIYTHGDVVPAEADLWVLKNGKKLHPFTMEVIGERIYGRGTEDDKCSIIAAIYAMEAIKKSGLPIKRSIRLFIETTEETGGRGIRHFKKKNQLPEFNVVLDSTYPVVTAEKGFGSLYIRFPREKNKRFPGLPLIKNITGGKAINQIPAESRIELSYPAKPTLVSRLRKLAAAYVKQESQHGVFQIKIEEGTKAGDLVFRVIGDSAHSSQPWNGVNPVPRALGFLDFLDKSPEHKEFAEEHFKSAVTFAARNFGLGYKGKKLGVDYKDDFMGPLTASITWFALNEKQLELGVNFRTPRGKTAKELEAAVSNKLNNFRKSSGLKFTYEITLQDAFSRNTKSPAIATMLDIFEKTTGKKGEPLSSAGATTARDLPGGVNFGPAMPGEKYRGHNANEFKKVKNFMLDVQMFTEMLLRLGNKEALN